MKTILSTAVAMLALVFFTGCPQGTKYTLCYDGKETADLAITGTWITADSDAEFKKAVIRKKDDFTLDVEVFEPGSNYSLDVTRFIARTTEISGHTFIESQPIGSSDTHYYLYCYLLVDDSTLKTYDIILPHGMIHVSSTDTYREEVEEALEAEGLLVGERVWRRE